MHIVYRSLDGDRDLDVELRTPEATIADVVSAVPGASVPSTVAIDDRVVSASCLVVDSGLHEGAVLTPRRGQYVSGAASTRSGCELVVVAGLDAGRAFALPAAVVTLGRDSSNTVVLSDLLVSRRHCKIEFAHSGEATVTDLGSANGTIVDGLRLPPEGTGSIGPGSVLEIGGTGLALRAVSDADRPRGLDLRRQVGPAGTASFNRPPRPALAGPPGPIEAPTAPGEPSKPHFSMVSTVGPLILAVVLVLIMRDLRFALFAMLSPLIAVGTYAESRRRSSREAARDRRRYESDLEQFKRHVDDAATTERMRLRDMCPDPAEVLRRAALPSVRMWQRRTYHDDFLRLFAGLGDVAWRPPREGSGKLPVEVTAVLDACRINAAPVCVDLSDGGVVGIVGDRADTLAAARSLVCQAAVHHGPADLTIGVFVDPGREPDWDWCKWLPHTHPAAGRERWLAARREHSDALLRALGNGSGTGTVLVVLDSDVLTEGQNSPARDLLGAGRRGRPDGFPRHGTPVAGVVVAASADRLPAACTTVIEIANSDGNAVVRRPDEGAEVGDVLVAGMSLATARTCARHLARFEDPELRQPGAGLPDSVRLLPLLDLKRVDADAIRKRWRRAGPAAQAVAPLGVTEHGVFTLDLVRDGPHALIGGTTGSGKSELLRSLVAALAVHADATQLTFVLMDYKGGAAFDQCARLPHTVGMVTDLDEQLGERALRALEAELQYRERKLRGACADNLREYLALNPPEPLPRLIVVIDEFATMAKELPEFLTALVGIAQRGRTLGVHMILATQRPSGAVNDNIRTNTNLRIALRVQDADDSIDVIGQRDAADLSRHNPGRAYVRLGPGEIVPIQTALVTCVTNERADSAVAVTPFEFGPAPRDQPRDEDHQGAPRGDGRPRSDLARLVDAIAEAHRADGLPAPRKPWPEPLPARIDLADLVPAEPASGVPRAVVALADDPRLQDQYPVGWDLAEGNLLIFGIPGSGTTTALTSLALSLATTLSPEEMEIYALDYGSGDLSALERLPHTGSVILANDRERQMRLVRHLRGELDRRRGQQRAGTPGRRIVVLIDNLAAMRAEFDDVEGLALMDGLTRVYADGPETGISFAVTADRLTTVPTAWASVTTQKWLFRLTDVYDYVSAGLTRKDVPQPVPGRAVMAPGGLQIQLGQPLPAVPAAVGAVADRYPPGPRRAVPIGVLPADVSFESLGAVSELSDEPWRIPFGIRESDLDVAWLVLYEGEHALVAGPARSGKSTALWTLAESLRSGQGTTKLHVAATGGRRSPLRDCPALDRFATAGGDATAMFAQLRTIDGPVVVLIDDAEGFDDTDSAIEGLLGTRRPDLHVIAAGRADSLRSLYGHWTQTVRRSKAGLLLRPNIDLDGDLLGVTLPRRAPVQMIRGRGCVVHNGEQDVVQLARPEESATRTANSHGRNPS